MTRKVFQILLAILIVLASQLSAPPAASAQTAWPEVTARFSRNGLVLTMKSQADFEQLWGLQIKYCDGTSEQLGRHSRRGVFGRNLSRGYKFYAEKPMQQVLITSLPTEDRVMAPNFRTTVVRRSCDLPDPRPKLACHDVQVARVIHRAWEGEPISFKSNSRVYFAGLQFPGVDGLAPVRVATYKEKVYQPSLKYNFKQRVWSGTFISSRVPLGRYEKVMLVVEDIYGSQAKCPVGKILVIP